METSIIRKSTEVIIGPARPTAIIGERINPTGKEWLKEALRAGDFGSVATLAAAQVAAGAQIIDVNVMVPGADEARLLPQAVEAIQRAVDVPLCLDSSNTVAIRSALAVCDGKVIINSVDGDQEKLDTILPLVREHKAAVLGLLVDRKLGIPKTADERFTIASRVLEAVELEGIPRADLIVDCLTLAVGVEQPMGQVALDTISRVSRELGLNVSMGVSNISFGLPLRPVLNAAFVAMAAGAGMTCAMINPEAQQVREAILAADVVLGRDNRARRFLQHYRSRRKAGPREA